MLGLPFKVYVVVCAPVVIFCPPVATVAMSSWMIGAGIVGDGSDIGDSSDWRLHDRD